MPTVTMHMISGGTKTLVFEKEVSNERIKQITDFFSKSKADAKERCRKALDNVPPIHWEILRAANKTTKDELHKLYPDHSEFIESINW